MERMKAEDLLTVLKDLGNDGATVSELVTLLGKTATTIRYHLKNLMAMEPCMITKKETRTKQNKLEWKYYYNAQNAADQMEESSHIVLDIDIPSDDGTETDGAHIDYVCQEIPVQLDQISDKDLRKNAEGYSDPTAEQAIKRYDSRKGFVVGGIYNTYSNSPFLVVGLYPDTILGYSVETSLLPINSDTEVSWVERNVQYNTDIVYTVHVNWLRAIPYNKLNANAQRKSCSMDTYNRIIKQSPLRKSYVIEDNTPKIDEADVRKDERLKAINCVREDLCDILKVPLDTSLESIEIRIAGMMDFIENHHEQEPNNGELEFYKMVYKDLIAVLKARV